MEGKELVTSKKGAVIVQYRKADEQNVCTATHSFPIMLPESNSTVNFQLVVQKSRRESAHACTLAGDFE